MTKGGLYWNYRFYEMQPIVFQKWVLMPGRDKYETVWHIGPVVLEKIFKYWQHIFAIYFDKISPWKRAGPFIWTNMNPLYPWMLCAKFGWNWPSGFWVEVKNTKSLQTEGQTDDGWQAIGKGHLSLQLTWAKNDNLNQNCHYLYLQKTFL